MRQKVLQKHGEHRLETRRLLLHPEDPVRDGRDHHVRIRHGLRTQKHRVHRVDVRDVAGLYTLRVERTRQIDTE